MWRGLLSFQPFALVVVVLGCSGRSHPGGLVVEALSLPSISKIIATCRKNTHPPNKGVGPTEVGCWCLGRVFHSETLAYNQMIVVSAAQDQVLAARSCKFNYRTHFGCFKLGTCFATYRQVCIDRSTLQTTC
jgi:hypothetical protein